MTMPDTDHAVGADAAPLNRVSRCTAPRPAPRRRSAPLTGDPADAVARIVVAGLFLGLVYRVGESVVDTGRVTALLLLVSESLVVVLTVLRRQAVEVDRRWSVRVVVAASVSGPMLLTPTAGVALLADAYTVVVSSVGLLLVVVGKMSLGRSFAILPANRGIVCTGMYRLVRHPIYVGYVLTHMSFLAAHATVWNVAMLVLADLALVVRVRFEEETLARDSTYRAYRRRVVWRFVPGVY